MELFHRAVNTLYAHTVERTLGYFGDVHDSDSETPTVIHLGPPEPHVLLTSTHISTPVEEVVSLEEAGPQSFKSIGSVLGSRTDDEDLSHTVAFVASTDAPLFGAPTKAFDTVITTLPYGSMVMVLEEKGRFSNVSQNGIIGWVQRDDLRSRAAHVFPEFVPGVPNEHDDPSTLRVRACIKDAFYGGEIEMPLQAGEYVLYMLTRKNQNINWPPTRPRTPGLWHSILRGVPGVHVSITPKTGSVMEYTLPNDTGHLAYVEAVFPDDRVSISEVNYPDQGIYSERTLTKEEWQVLNPVFIQVT